MQLLFNSNTDLDEHLDDREKEDATDWANNPPPMLPKLFILNYDPASDVVVPKSNTRMLACNRAATVPLITYIPMSEKLPDKIDLTRCMAFKSKSDKSQCPCRHRAGSRFCGKHAQTKQEILANGTRRSINRTLMAPTAQTRIHTNNTTRHLTKQPNIQQPNIQQPNIQQPTKQLITKTKQITHLGLCKDPYLSKLTSQQINDNFLFYKLNTYLNPANTNTNTNKTRQLDITTEHKRKLLIRLLTLLAKIDYLDPQHKKIIKIQQAIRKSKYRIRQWNRGKGVVYPLIQCTNKDDFCSLDPLDTIPSRLLFTYRDIDGFTYGFNLLSFLELLSGTDLPLNPYTRKPIMRNVINRANKYYRILTNWSKVDKSDVLKQHPRPSSPANSLSQQPGARLSFKDRIKQRLQTVFQKVNYLGYQTNTEWLLDKSTPVLVSFIKTMARNWSYQLGFADSTKQQLMPAANLQVFEALVIDAYRQNQQLGHISSFHLLNRILDTLEPLINNPADPNSAALLVLYSLYYIEPRRVSLANPWMN